MTDIQLPDPDYPRPERAENGKAYYWRPSGYPTDRYLAEVRDTDLLQHMGVPPRFRAHVLRMYRKSFRREVETWIAQMPYIFRPAPSRLADKPELCGIGLLLWGDSGTYKTTTAAAVLLRLIRMQIPNLHPDPLPLKGGTYTGAAMGRFVPWQDAVEAFRNAVGDPESDEESEGEFLRRSMRCESRRAVDAANFLVLDDISRERVTEWNFNELHRIMRFRHDYARPTIVTTNYDPDDWEKKYGEVFAAFLHRAFIPVEFIKTDD